MTLPISPPAQDLELLAPAPIPAIVPLASPNGSSLQRPSRLPQARRRSKGFRLLVLAAVVVVVAASSGSAWFFLLRGSPTRTDLVTYKVKRQDLQLKVVERGGLESANNHDVKCDVKAGSRGAPKIKSVVDNGKLVEKGELLMDIDESALTEQSQKAKVDRDTAESAMITAKEQYPIAESAVPLAKENQRKWKAGDFPQQLHDLEGQEQMAESDKLQYQDRASWASRMVKKGYMTASQEDAERSRLRGAELNLLKIKELKTVLIEFTDKTQQKTLENAVLDAESKKKAAAALRDSTKQIFEINDKAYKDLLDEISKCKIYAPHPGLVVYAVPEQTRMGSGSSQSIIAQGEPVQYGQKLMSIPDLTHMLVNVRIHEAFINYMKDGLPALVRVDAAPGKMLRAHVKSVANIASPQDWMSPDVKVYQAMVEIDDSVEDLKLKPGLSAEVTIFTDAKVDQVIAVPMQAVLSPIEKGKKPRCFVLTPEGPAPREVEIGLNDEKFVEIKSGLQVDDEVVLNPRALLSDKDKKATQEDDKANPNGAKRGGPGKPEGGRGGPPAGGESGGRSGGGPKAGPVGNKP